MTGSMEAHRIRHFDMIDMSCHIKKKHFVRRV